MSERRNQHVALAVTICLLTATLAISKPAAVAADGKTAGLTTVSLVITGQQGPVATIFYYGIEQGIFKKHGIDLKISAPTNASTTTDVVYVAKGQYDMGNVGGPASMLYRQKYGGDVVIFYGYIQNNVKCLVVGVNSGINSVKDLKGKKIGFASNTPFADMVAYLKSKGLEESDYTLVPLSNSAVNSSYISDKIDAALSFDVNIPIFNDAGKQSKAFCERDDGFNYQQVDIATTQAYINAHRSVVANFAAALAETTKLAKANSIDAAGAVYRANPAQKPIGPQVPVQQFQYVLKSYKTANDGGHDFGWMSPKDWVETQNQALRFFDLKPGLDFKSGWTNEFVH
jgi:NitT/TauT family transport system substrate-binding protein